MTSIDIPFAELSQHDEFIGQMIFEDGVEIRRPLTRFHYSAGFLSIYANDNGDEVCIGGVRGISAELSPDGVLHITGPFAPTFLLFLEEENN